MWSKFKVDSMYRDELPYEKYLRGTNYYKYKGKFVREYDQNEEMNYKPEVKIGSKKAEYSSDHHVTSKLSECD